MNPSTGHLLAIGEGMPNREKRRMKASGYEPVPKELEAVAANKLAGQDEAYVSLTSGGKLSKWAASRRKAKRKMAQVSKRRNRG